MAPWNQRFLLETIIFMFHVKFGECMLTFLNQAYVCLNCSFLLKWSNTRYCWTRCCLQRLQRQWWTHLTYHVFHLLHQEIVPKKLNAFSTFIKRPQFLSDSEWFTRTMVIMIWLYLYIYDLSFKQRSCIFSHESFRHTHTHIDTFDTSEGIFMEIYSPLYFLKRDFRGFRIDQQTNHKWNNSKTP